MADTNSFQIPNSLTFEKALEITQMLLERMATNTLSEAETQQAIASLVATENGARGFFVLYLSDERSLADHPSPPVLEALKTAPQVISSLLVKNLAMSTATAIAHRRNQNEEQAQGSDQVQRRTTQLIQLLQIPDVKHEAMALIESIDTHAGRYETFLNRWHYDAEQQEAMRRAIERAIESR